MFQESILWLLLRKKTFVTLGNNYQLPGLNIFCPGYDAANVRSSSLTKNGWSVWILKLLQKVK